MPTKINDSTIGLDTGQSQHAYILCPFFEKLDGFSLDEIMFILFTFYLVLTLLCQTTIKTLYI